MASPFAKRSRGLFFNPLQTLKKALTFHDIAFLRRQVTYHISAPADLPRVWAREADVGIVMSLLIGHMLSSSTRGSAINISFQKFSLQSGPAVQLSFSSNSSEIAETSEEKFISAIFGVRQSGGFQAIADCRAIVSNEGGRFFAELPRAMEPVYHIVLPACEPAAAVKLSKQFKYDISIIGYPNFRKRFGIKKSEEFVLQIERYVRSLVCQPMDMVVSALGKGIVTAIYEAREGAGASVASRISERLGQEQFRIGKKAVQPSFSYNLTPFSSAHQTGPTPPEEKGRAK